MLADFDRQHGRRSHTLEETTGKVGVIRIGPATTERSGRAIAVCFTTFDGRFAVLQAIFELSRGFPCTGSVCSKVAAFGIFQAVITGIGNTNRGRVFRLT